MIAETWMDCIGNTPLLQLHCLSDLKRDVRCYGKLELLNPGGSVKDRTALGLIAAAEEQGLLRKGGTVVESTSGNLGRSLAIICAIKGYAFVCVVDAAQSPATCSLLKAYGARVEVVTMHDEYGNYQRARIARAREIADSIPGAINLNQYDNPAARAVHYATTGPEIYADLGDDLNVLIGCVSTGGHLCGTAAFLKEQIPHLKVIGVEPQGSVVFGGERGTYRIRGAGLSFRPSNYDSTVVDEEIKVADSDAFAMARRFARREGLLVGSSSGAALQAASSALAAAPTGTRCVVLLPDSGMGDVATVYSED